MNDMSAAIIPKSDQWNFDDFQAGPITFTIRAVSVKRGQEQPVEMSVEGSEKFYRPCKSMARVLVSAWGPDSAKYVGRSLTLYGDPKVKWGGLEVGGIRISHMSNIDSALTMALTVTRANKKPFTVKPISGAKPKAAATQDHTEASVAGSKENGANPASAAVPTDEAIVADVDKLISTRKFQSAADTASLIADDAKRDFTLERVAKAYKEARA